MHFKILHELTPLGGQRRMA